MTILESFWAVLTCGALLMSVYQIGQTFAESGRRPFVTDLQILASEPIPFPQIQICSYNSVNKSKLATSPFVDYASIEGVIRDQREQVLVVTYLETLLFANDSLLLGPDLPANATNATHNYNSTDGRQISDPVQDFYQSVRMDVEEVFRACFHNGLRFNCTRHISYVMTNTGVCFVLDDLDHQLVGGTGLVLLMDVHSELADVRFALPDFGVHVKVEERLNEASSAALLVAPGTSAKIQLKVLLMDVHSELADVRFALPDFGVHVKVEERLNEASSAALLVAPGTSAKIQLKVLLMDVHSELADVRFALPDFGVHVKVEERLNEASSAALLVASGTSAKIQFGVEYIYFPGDQLPAEGLSLGHGAGVPALPLRPEHMHAGVHSEGPRPGLQLYGGGPARFPRRESPALAHIIRGDGWDGESRLVALEECRQSEEALRCSLRRRRSLVKEPSRCLRDCRPKCVSWEYSPTASFAAFPSAAVELRTAEEGVNAAWNSRPGDLVFLNVLFEHLQFTRVSQSKRLTAAAAFGQIGGNLGLWLGASFLSLIQVATLCLSACQQSRTKAGNKEALIRTSPTSVVSSVSLVDSHRLHWRPIHGASAKPRPRLPF